MQHHGLRAKPGQHVFQLHPATGAAGDDHPGAGGGQFFGPRKTDLERQLLVRQAECASPAAARGLLCFGVLYPGKPSDNLPRFAYHFKTVLQAAGIMPGDPLGGPIGGSLGGYTGLCQKFMYIQHRDVRGGQIFARILHVRAKHQCAGGADRDDGVGFLGAQSAQALLQKVGRGVLFPIERKGRPQQPRSRGRITSTPTRLSTRTAAGRSVDKPGWWRNPGKRISAGKR